MKYRFDQVLGLSLIGVALGIAVGIVLFVLLGDSSIPLTLLGLPATMVLIGFTLVFSDYIETKLRLDDEMSQLPELIEDDIEALKHGKLSSTHLMLISSGAAILAHFALVIKYKKWQFEFLGLNVLVVVAAVTLIAIYVGFRSSWFQWRDIRTPRAIYLIPLAAFVLSAGLGLYYAEPIERGGRTRIEGRDVAAGEYNYSRTRASRITAFSFIDSGWDIAVPDCDGEACAVAVLFMIIVIIAIICVLGSVFIPQFWVVATALLATIMTIISVRELFFVERANGADGNLDGGP